MGKWYNLKDDDLMPFGKHKNLRMIDVPADYLIYIYKDGEMIDGNVKDYIVSNLEVLKDECGKDN